MYLHVLSKCKHMEYINSLKYNLFKENYYCFLVKHGFNQPVFLCTYKAYSI